MTQKNIGLVLATVCLACCGPCPKSQDKKEAAKMKIEVHQKSSLPFVDLGWVKMSDHFVATVGPAAGQGAPWNHVLVLADATFAPHSQFPLHIKTWKSSALFSSAR
jgi:hypothetical protein